MQNPEGEQGLQIGRQIALRAVGQYRSNCQPLLRIGSGNYCHGDGKIRSGMGECYVAGGVKT